MKPIQVIFKNPVFNFCTDCNPSASNESIKRYFLDNSFNVGTGEDHREQPIQVRFLHDIISGSFAGERGYISLSGKANPLVHAHTAKGEVFAVTKKQIKQVV